MRETEMDEEPDYRINLPSGAVVDVTVNKVEPWEKFPSGWHYSLHYGTRDGETILRYDNGHADDAHHRHTAEGRETVEFPGMEELYERFLEKVRQHEQERS
jgi:hypothetical protein